MRKPKYSLSGAGMDNLMEKLERISKENADEAAQLLLEGQVTTDFVKRMTKVKGIEEVIERNEQLSKAFVGLINMYGFESMYDLYIYAMSCDSQPVSKAKDYSKLVPVKRKVVRNGKETEVTIWEDPNKGGETGDTTTGKDSSGRKGGTTKRKHARELLGGILKDKDLKNPKELAKLKNAASTLPKGNKPFLDSSQHFLTIKDESNRIVGIVGYSAKGNFLVMDFYRTNGEVSGVATRGFFELLRLALEEKKGVKVDDQPEARSVFIQVRLTQEGKTWSITYDELAASLGESDSEHG